MKIPTHRSRSKTWPFLLICLAVGIGGAQAQAQARLPPPPVPDGPMEFDASDNVKLRVAVMTRGLSHPWALAFLPDGDMLVTERAGRVRIIRKGLLDPNPVATVQVATTFILSGLMDIALHPRFAENKFIYLTYNKPGPDNGRIVTLARGHWDGSKLIDIVDLLVTDARIGASRIAFGRDGFLYMVVGGPPGPADAMASQDLNKYTGKVLRLRDDGSAAPNNPFDRAGSRPEIFSLGHRNALGLALNPATGDIWETENGPQGGDEVNIILPGRNYGWPIVSFGRWYDGPRVTDNPYRDGMELPVVYWVPAIATSGMAFYTSDRIPQWKGNLFVGGLQQGRTPQTGHIERIVFNSRWAELHREPLLTSLKQRIREVREGPDGALYVLTDEDEGVLLRIDPSDIAPRPGPGAASRASP
jgi:aldose sugar dehydrogenase